MKYVKISRQTLFDILRYIKRREEDIDYEFNSCRRFARIRKEEPQSQGVKLFNHLINLKSHKL